MKIFIFIFLLFLASCKLGPPYQGPEVNIPEGWKEELPSTEEVNCTLDYWWEIFEDEGLNELELQALNGNWKLEEGYQRILDARAQVEVARSRQFPQINLDPYADDLGAHIKASPQKGFPALGKLLSLPNRIHLEEFSIPLDMNYEVDLFGKIQGQVDYAAFSAQASYEDYLSTLLTLTSDLASDYFNMRSLDTQIAILKRTLSLREDSLKLTTERNKKGLVSMIDVEQAELLVYGAKIDLEEAERNRRIFENAIASLIGVPAPEFEWIPKPIEKEPPQVPLGLPSEILLRRPDLLQLERVEAANHAQIGVAYASFFPSLSLTGSIGYLNLSFHDFIKLKSKYWSLGANGSENVFDGGANAGNLESAWARFSQADANYQAQVLTAFEEVENALNNITRQKKEYELYSSSTVRAQSLANRSTVRYKQGLTTYLEVLDSLRSELNAELNQAVILGQEYISTIQLIKALGGGW